MTKTWYYPRMTTGNVEILQLLAIVRVLIGDQHVLLGFEFYRFDFLIRQLL
jgi:hypothetical protein